MADSDRQTDKQGDQNLTEKGEERKRNKISLTLSDILVGHSCSLRLYHFFIGYFLDLTFHIEYFFDFIVRKVSSFCWNVTKPNFN